MLKQFTDTIAYNKYFKHFLNNITFQNLWCQICLFCQFSKKKVKLAEIEYLMVAVYIQ